jgi:uncharacterized integral membrane protein
MVNITNTHMKLPKTFRRRDAASFWFPVALGALLLAMGGLVASVALLGKSQDLRQQASEQKAEIIVVPNTTPLRASEDSRISLRFNTRGEEVAGVQFAVNVSGDGVGEPSISYRSPSGLNKSWDKTDNIDKGKKFTAIFLTSDFNKAYKTTDFVELAEISFKGSQSGKKVTISFDSSWTGAPSYRDSGNTLKSPSTSEYTLEVAQPSPSPTATPRTTTGTGTGGVTRRVTPKPTPKVVATLMIDSEVSPSPSPSPSPTMTPRPTTSPTVRNVPSEPPTSGNEVVAAEASLSSRIFRWVLILGGIVALIGVALFAFFKFQERTGQESDSLRY